MNDWGKEKEGERGAQKTAGRAVLRPRFIQNLLIISFSGRPSRFKSCSALQHDSADDDPDRLEGSDWPILRFRYDLGS